MTRIFVAIISILSELMGDFDNSNLYILLTEPDRLKISENLIHSKPILIVTFICSIISIFSHYKIEKFKKHVDSQRKFDQLEEVEECQEQDNEDCELGKNTGNIIIAVGCVINLIVIIYMFNITKEIVIRRHEALLLIHFLDLNVIPMIFAVRNENIFNFFKNEIKMYCLFILHYYLIVFNVIVRT